MYRITAPSGETFLTEKVTYVRQHKPGVFLITDQQRAEGVNYHGMNYLYKDGTQCHEFDGADEIRRLSVENAELKAVQADTDEMVIDHEYRMMMLESSVNV